MRYIELFAGAGGMSRGIEAAGMTCVAHAEWDAHAQSVLRHHWPDTPLHGDVTEVDWTAYAGQVDLVSGGSPCQDLSLAGRRAGLAGSRSNLFYELIRAWDETRAPYCLWENVDGARSSNKGADFAAVLSAFVGADVAVPESRWCSSGVAAGPTGVAAWRVLDLQHFGPPQRRRRIFVVAARTDGIDPAEVLALSQGVCGHPSPRQQAREIFAKGIAGGFRSIGWDGEFNARAEIVGTLQARTKSGGVEHGVISFDNLPQISMQGIADTVTTEGARNPISVVVPPITSSYAKGMGSNGKDELFVVAGEQSNSAIGYGIAPTMGTTPAGRLWAASDIVHPTLNTSHFAKHFGCNQHVEELGTILPAIGRPRRLTPRECERLMGWPDDWTAKGTKSDGSHYAISDTSRYRLIGNGVGSPCAEWIARRLMEVVRHTQEGA